MRRNGTFADVSVGSDSIAALPFQRGAARVARDGWRAFVFAAGNPSGVYTIVNGPAILWGIMQGSAGTATAVQVLDGATPLFSSPAGSSGVWTIGLNVRAYTSLLFSISGTPAGGFTVIYVPCS